MANSTSSARVLQAAAQLERDDHPGTRNATAWRRDTLRPEIKSK